MNLKIAIAYAKIKKTNKPFYASDFDIDGGTINGLDNHGLIHKTGHTKEYMIDLGNGYYKRVDVYEWEKKNSYWAENAFMNVVEQAKELIDWLDLCEE